MNKGKISKVKMESLEVSISSASRKQLDEILEYVEKEIDLSEKCIEIGEEIDDR